MKSFLDPKFRRLLEQLPDHAQYLAEQKYQLWRENPGHPSLKFKEWAPRRWSARVGDHYRVLGTEVEKGVIVWTWIGSHERYNHLL